MTLNTLKLQGTFTFLIASNNFSPCKLQLRLARFIHPQLTYFPYGKEVICRFFLYYNLTTTLFLLLAIFSLNQLTFASSALQTSLGSAFIGFIKFLIQLFSYLYYSLFLSKTYISHVLKQVFILLNIPRPTNEPHL